MRRQDDLARFRVVLRKDAKIELLKGIPLFTGCSKRDLEEIARVTEEIHVDAGTVLIDEGQPGREAFVVVSGRLDVTRQGVGKVAEIGPGEVAGEMSLLSARPTSATVTATTPVHALRAGAADFVGLVDRMPLLWLEDRPRARGPRGQRRGARAPRLVGQRLVEPAPRLPHDLRVRVQVVRERDQRLRERPAATARPRRVVDLRAARERPVVSPRRARPTRPSRRTPDRRRRHSPSRGRR